MIEVKNIEQFDRLLQIAKEAGVPYSILGHENESFIGAFSLDDPPKKNNAFKFSYLLCCQLFTAHCSGHVALNNKGDILKYSETFQFTDLGKLSVADGVASLK